MRIYFDNITFALQKTGGVSSVWAALLKRISSKYVKGYLEYSHENNIFRKNLTLPEQKIINKQSLNIKLSKQLDVKISDDEKFIFHSSTYRLCTSNNALNVVTVHDFIDYYYNENFLKRNLKIFRMKHCIEKADAIICVSENTKKDLLKFHQKVDLAKIHVVHNGKSNDFKMDNSDLRISFPEINPQEYILFVGNRYGYKNFHLLIEAMTLYKKKKLVFVGGGNIAIKERHWLEQQLINYYHYQGLSNNELNLLYNNAYCLVYPSFYEGFGIPVLEAQSAGCPVVASNQSSLPEILGDSAILLDELTSSCLLRALTRLEDFEQREKFVLKGLENAKKFSYDTMAQQYLEIYFQLWSNN